MSNGFRVSKDLTLPLEAATWTFAILAIKGWGKTYDSGDIAEEMVKAGIPIIVIDGLGIWWGITVGVDGHDGLPVVVFGGKHKDLALPLKQIDRIRQNVDEDKLRLMVKAILEARISVVLDTSGLSKGIQRRVVATFISELTRLNAEFGTRHVFIEESDLWCPQKGLMGGGDLALSAGAIDDLVRRGGNFNLGCTLITQRSAVLNKDVLTQANCLVVGRILHKLDKQAVKTWVESVANPDDPKIKEWYDGLRDLKNGEAYVWHPEKPVISKQVMFRKRETLHATREYFQQVKRDNIKPLDRTTFIEKFNNIFTPKPKPQLVSRLDSLKAETKIIPEHLIKTPLGTTTVPQTTITTIPIKPPIPLKNGDVMEIKGVNGEMTFIHQVPNVTLIKERSTIQVPTEPSSPIGKVLVVLMNNKLNDWRWTGKKIKNLIRVHEWPEDGADEAIAELTRWEILVLQSNHYLHFNRNRVHVVEHETMREAT